MESTPFMRKGSYWIFNKTRNFKLSSKQAWHLKMIKEVTFKLLRFMIDQSSLKNFVQIIPVMKTRIFIYFFIWSRYFSP